MLTNARHTRKNERGAREKVKKGRDVDLRKPV